MKELSISTIGQSTKHCYATVAMLLLLAVFSKAAVAAPAAPISTVSAEESTNIRIYKAANKAVVNIGISGGEESYYSVVPREGFGSGTIISADGYILTNYHVIENANQIRVTLWDGTVLPATRVGEDPANDLAVLKINAPETTKLTTIPFGDSSKLEVGRKVLAIGNPFGLDRTLSEGIVSSLGRSIMSENGRIIKGII